jgi:thymidine kinase
MSSGKSTVITVYGHNRVIDKIAVNIFDKSNVVNGKESEAQIYCNSINSLVLQGESWVHAKIISEYKQYAVERFIPLEFDVFLFLDDRSVQTVVRKIDEHDLALALKGESKDVQEKLFRSLSKRAAQMLKKDMYFTKTTPDVKLAAQEKIMDIVRRLEQTGEIIVPYPNEEIVV